MVNIKNRQRLLIVMGGLPGVGKTTISKELALRLDAVYLRIDTIEQALFRENQVKVEKEGYKIAYCIAEDNLRIGNTIVVDSVNSIPITRESWHTVAKLNESPILEVEIVCSDQEEHRDRVERRRPDIIGHKMPTWEDVMHRDYHEWDTKNMTIDTAKENVFNSVERILDYIKNKLKTIS